MAYQYPFKYADEGTKLAVWSKGRPIAGQDSRYYRSDICGALMLYSAHGDRNNVLGWEIDHIKPQAKGGTDDLGNLQPLNWKNNEKKSDTYPWSCT
jgi:HNH endonuclease